MSSTVLVVDDDRELGRLLEATLAERGFAATWRASAAEALDVLGASDLDAIVTDIEMSGMNGLELCERIMTNRPDVPVIILSAYGNLDTAVEAMRAGAYDFLTKPPDFDAVALAIERAVQHRRLRDEVTRLRRAVEDARGFGELLFASPVMEKLVDLLERVVDSDASVLITGETGTGKELVARALHRRGRRARGPFVAISCAAVPESLLESELFGYRRGAFTDARTDRTGLFVQASGGTLFLDEIAELPIGLQPKLLRTLQERVVRPIGADAECPIDVRIVSATNQDLELLVREGRFRQDLYFRIDVIHLNVPPLRARGNDVLLLAQRFVERYATQANKSVLGLSAPTAERLLAYEWPGNVRELQNCVERAVALARYEQIGPDDLPATVGRYRPARIPTAEDDGSPIIALREIERQYILRVLDHVHGNRTAAAQLLGVDRKTLVRHLKHYASNDRR